MRLALGIVFIILSNVFAIYPAQLFRKGIDAVAVSLKNYTAANDVVKPIIQSEAFTQIMQYGLLIIGIALLRGVFVFMMRQTIIVMSRLIEYDLKNDIYQQYQRLSLSFYKKNKTGDLMNRISEDVSQVRMYIGPAIMYITNLVFMVVMVLFTMLNVNAELTLYVLLPLPLMSIAIFKVHSIINDLSAKRQAQLSTMSSFVQEGYSGIRVLKAYGRTTDFEERFDKQVNEYKRRALALVKVDSMFFPVMNLLIGTSIVLIVYIGGGKALQGSVTPGNIAEFIMYVNMLTFPFASVGWVTSLMQKAAASQERINEFLNTEPEIVSPPQAITKPIVGAVSFKEVTFTYPDTGITALNNLSFDIYQGHSLAILGRTGAGKSTITALVSRLFDTSTGQVLIDGNNIKQYDLATLRTAIGYVPQEVFLFSDTIANNIAFGLNTANLSEAEIRAKVEQAAKDACVYDNIMGFPKGFDTMVGERGITLSGGQKQRISIARAIIKEPTILVFDDCLSAVDTQTEEEILNNLSRIMQGKTTIIISHRVSSVQMADSIVVIENGSIIEEGNHHRLLAQEGYYAELYRKQILEGSEV